MPPATYQRTETADTDYRCTDCGAVIDAGVEHEASGELVRGTGWQHYRTCLECVVMRGARGDDP